MFVQQRQPRRGSLVLAGQPQEAARLEVLLLPTSMAQPLLSTVHPPPGSRARSTVAAVTKVFLHVATLGLHPMPAMVCAV